MKEIPGQVAAQAMGPSFISADDARSVLNWPDVIAKLRAVYARPHASMASPPRTQARVGSSWVRTLTAVPPGCRFMGAKIFGVGPRFRVNYVIVLIEQDTGLIRSFIDGHSITTYRTAGTSAVAMDKVLPSRSISVGIIGSGDEARSHAEAIAAIRPIASMRIFSPTASNRSKLASRLESTLGVKALAVSSAEAAVSGAELVIAAARSRDESPLLYADWVKESLMIVSIGSTMLEQREIDVSVVDTCDLIIGDAVDELAHDTGDMVAARKAGIEFESKLISLDAAISGAEDARLHGARRPLFKSVGAGIQDIAIAELVFTKMQEAGRVRPLPIHFYTKQ
jgi:alanine dehydrogenase